MSSRLISGRLLDGLLATFCVFLSYSSWWPNRTFSFFLLSVELLHSKHGKYFLIFDLIWHCPFDIRWGGSIEQSSKSFEQTHRKEPRDRKTTRQVELDFLHLFFLFSFGFHFFILYPYFDRSSLFVFRWALLSFEFFIPSLAQTFWIHNFCFFLHWTFRSKTHHGSTAVRTMKNVLRNIDPKTLWENSEILSRLSTLQHKTLNCSISQHKSIKTFNEKYFCCAFFSVFSFTLTLRLTRIRYEFRARCYVSSSSRFLLCWMAQLTVIFT